METVVAFFPHLGKTNPHFVPALCTFSLIVIVGLLGLAFALVKGGHMVGLVDKGIVFDARLFLYIATCSILAKFVAEFDAWYVFGMHMPWFSLVLPLLSSLTALRESAHHQEGKAGPVGRVAILSSGYDIAASVWPVAAGIWGTEAFTHATEMFAVSPNNLPWDQGHLDAAMALYRIMKPVAYYGLFGALPAVWLLKAAVETLHVKHPKTPNKPLLSRLTLACLSLLLLSVTVANRSYDLGAWYYGDPTHGNAVTRTMLADSKALFSCTQSVTTDAAILPCYQTAGTQWQSQIHYVDLTIWQKLSAKGKQHFLQDEMLWNANEAKYLAGVAKHTPTNVSGQLTLAKERLRGLEGRLDDLCDKGTEQGYLDAKRAFLPDP